MNFDKKFGQNFIFDTGFLNGILDKLDLKSTDTVVEIGTGLGTLTDCIAPRVKQVITYEIDKRLEPKFTHNNIEFICQDILKVKEFPSEFVVVANIPYYITTPIIMKFLKMPACKRICILIQDDVAKRIVAKVGTKEYGALSVTIQAQATARIIKAVPRTVFRPQPKVDSAFIVIEKNHNILPHNFDEFIKHVFSQRRKTLRASLGIDSNKRPEEITPEQFVKICQEIHKTDATK